MNEIKGIMGSRLPLKQRILYAPVGAGLWLLSRLPFRVLYLFADILAFLARDVVRYRRNLVRRNIRDSFPEKSEAGLLAIERGFYSHLADYFVETVKFPAMSHKQLKKRMVFRNTRIIEEAFSQGSSIVIYTSHFGNWEWITSLPLWCAGEDAVYAHVYRTLKNRWFDDYFLRVRSIWNESIEMKSVLRRFVEWKKTGQLFITGFLSDQKPDLGGRRVVVDFLSRPTEFIAGTAELAAKFGTKVMYFDTEIMRRGYYQATIRLLSENASRDGVDEITRSYARMLENTILRHPEAYLWSHNKWRLPKTIK